MGVLHKVATQHDIQVEVHCSQLQVVCYADKVVLVLYETLKYSKSNKRIRACTE